MADESTEAPSEDDKDDVQDGAARREQLRMLQANVTSWSVKTRTWFTEEAADWDVALVAEHRQDTDQLDTMKKDMRLAGWWCLVRTAQDGRRQEWPF